MPQGYVKLHRKLLDNSLLWDGDALRLFIYLLLRANHQGKQIMFNNQTIDLKRGELVAGRNVISADLAMNPSQVYKKMEILKKRGILSVKSNNRFSLITIVNYTKYQDKLIKCNSQSNSQVTATEQPSNTNKNVKNERMKELNTAETAGIKNHPYLEKFKKPSRLNSSKQLLAAEVWEWLFRPKSLPYAAILKIINQKGEQFVRETWSEGRQSELKDRMKWFLWKVGRVKVAMVEKT